MTKRKPYANPARRKFIGHLRREFADLRRMIKKHDSSISWAHGPFLAERDSKPMA